MVLALLTPRNRLICEVAIQTGLRIGDVVSLPSNIKQRATVHEAKTGKSRRIYIPADLLDRCQAQAIPPWLFPGRGGSKTGHQTRQAVWYDIKRAQRAMRVTGKIYAPHSLRKVYAVNQMHKTGDLTAVQRALNHDDPSVTLLYALADVVAQRRPTKKRRRKKNGRNRNDV